MNCQSIRAEVVRLLQAGPQGWAALRPTFNPPTKAIMAAARSSEDHIERRCQFMKRYKGQLIEDDVEDISQTFDDAVDLLRTQIQGKRDYREARQKVILDTWPAAELITIKAAPQGWKEHWQRAGGIVYQDRALALKDSNVWQRFSAFGQPYEPFDWDNSFSVQDVDYSTALAAGLITPRTGTTAATSRQKAIQGTGQGCAWVILLGACAVIACGSLAASAF